MEVQPESTILKEISQTNALNCETRVAEIVSKIFTNLQDLTCKKKNRHRPSHSMTVFKQVSYHISYIKNHLFKQPTSPPN